MGKKVVAVICSLLVAGVLLLTIGLGAAEQAVCKKGHLTCTGECCKVTADGCIGGPCDRIK